MEIKFNGPGTNASLWVDPTSSTNFYTPLTSAYAEVTNMATLGADGVENLRLFPGGAIGDGSNHYTQTIYDEIHFGNSVNYVV